jgi:hypothetical protein
LAIGHWSTHRPGEHGGRGEKPLLAAVNAGVNKPISSVWATAASRRPASKVDGFPLACQAPLKSGIRFAVQRRPARSFRLSGDAPEETMS